MENLIREQLKTSSFFRDLFFKEWIQDDEGSEDNESLYMIYREHDAEVRILKKILRKYEAEKK